MIYDIVKPGEEQAVKAIWKSEQKALGIPYMTDITDYCNSGELFCIRDDERNLIGYCTYDVMKKHPEIRLSALVVLPEYRGKGYSKQLIYQTYLKAKDYIEKLGYDFVAEAVEGIPNNTFYDRISSNMTRHQKKTMVVRRYYLDINKIKTWGPSMWEGGE